MAEISIATPSQAWVAMETYRQLPRDLRGGVPLVQKRRDRVLFRAAKETNKDYEARIKRLTIEPYYWASCEHLGGQPFQEPTKWSDDTPPIIVDDWAKNVDGTQRDFRAVAWTACTASVGFGLQLVLVLWDEKRERPKIQVFPGEALLDPWEDGSPVRLTTHEYVRDEKQPWRKLTVEQIMVLYDGDPTAASEGDGRYARYEIFEHETRTNPKTAWKDEPSETGTFTPQTEIPLFPLYTGGGSSEDLLPWICYPPLYDFAVINRTHINKRSDLDFGLHISNIPQRAGSGLTMDEAKEIDTVSYKGMWFMSNPSGQFYYVEHGGASFDISLRDLDGLERKCEIFGLSPLLSKETNNVTATGRKIDLGRATITAQAWALTWEDTWQQVWRCAARYARIPQTFTMQLFTEFGPKEKDIERAKVIQEDYLHGDLPPEMYFPEMQRLGVYTEAFDAKAAADAVTKRREEMLSAMEAASKVPRPGTAQPPGTRKPPAIAAAPPA